MSKKELFIVVAGNIVSGLSFYGPFYSELIAIDWAEAVQRRMKYDDFTWSVTSLQDPDAFYKEVTGEDNEQSTDYNGH